MALPILTAGTVTAMINDTGHPVFFLTLGNAAGPTLTVKGEDVQGGPSFSPATSAAHTTTTLQWGSKMMKNVNDTDATAKLMTPVEIAAFKQEALRFFAQDPNVMATVNAPGKVWIKMAFITGLSTANIEKKNLNGVYEVKEADLKVFLTKLATKATWKDMGKVAAVDIFSGNNDRFDDNGLANEGNLMFKPTGGNTYSVLGLDSLDPASDHANLVSVGRFDKLRTLIDDNMMRTYADTVTLSISDRARRWLKKSINANGVVNGKSSTSVIGSDGTKLTVMTKLDPNDTENCFKAYSTEFQAGLREGSRDLKTYLLAKVEKYKSKNASLWTTGANARPLAKVPLMGGQRNPVQNAALQARNTAQVNAQAATQAHRTANEKTIPAGILDRMKFLHWIA